MFFIENCNSGDNFRTLTHSDTVFHEALAYVRGSGEVNFRVLNENGEDYCLRYERNEEIQRSAKEFPDSPLFTENRIFPDYLDYDETDTDAVYLGIFDNYPAVYFQNINEYAVVLVRLLLKFTDKRIYVRDRRFSWFLKDEDRDRIIYADETEDIHEEKLMIVRKDFVFNTLVRVFDLIDPVCLFHNVFVLQYVRSLSDRRITRLVVKIPNTEGIGSILNNFFRIKLVAERYGVETFLKSGCTRYDDGLLQKYFKIQISDDNPENILVESLFTLAFTYIVLSPEYVLNKSILSDGFLSNLEEYKQAVFGDKRILGVLVRGSDYIATNMPIQPLPIDELIPLIEETMKEGGFEYVFLATEDKDYYDSLTSYFKGRIYAVSQNRVSLDDLKSCSFLSNFEKNKSREEGYADIAEDNLSNYFYAIYLLSECQGFLGMPSECNGVLMAKEFNANRYEFFKTVTRNV